MSTIPFNLQFFVEKERNNKFGWMIYGIGIALFAAYGVFFHVVQKHVRVMSRRSGKAAPQAVGYFKLLQWWNSFTRTFTIKAGWYFELQPSLFVLFIAYAGVNAAFCVVQTVDLDYQPRSYIIAKRIGRVAIGNIPLLYLFVLKNDLLGLITGLSHTKLNLLHRWMGRFIWCMIVTHLSLTITYWLNLDFPVMLVIPPQIFGMIAFGCMTIVTFAGTGQLRKMFYEFFLFNHGVFAAIMLLAAYFHNPQSLAPVIVAIHTLVIDRIVSMIRAFMIKRSSSTKCIANIKIIEEPDGKAVMKIYIPLTRRRYIRDKLSFGSWSPGQHVYLRVGKVAFLQWHPFTIANTPDSSEDMLLVVQKYNGFTKKMLKRAKKLRDDSTEMQSIQMKCMIHGPYGANFQPPHTFNNVVFAAGGTGASFTFSICLGLLQQLRDTGRESCVKITFVWYIQRWSHQEWYSECLEQLLSYAKDSAFELNVRVFVTREAGSSSASVVSGDEKKQIAEPSPRIRVAHEKPHIAGIINTELESLDEVKDEIALPTFAMFACGPRSLVADAKEECQKSWPGIDVYSYVEKYDV